jgi:choline dehydrogenase-like flavoprotein
VDRTLTCAGRVRLAADPLREELMPAREGADVLVIGSGMGGATFAAGLGSSGAKILILERGERLPDSEAVRDPRAIFQQGIFRPKEFWFDGAGRPFNPGNYYYVGGNTKFYGAVLFRYRAEDFGPIVHRGGTTPGWPFAYEELEPWYTAAERLYRVRGALGLDRTEPRHSKPYPFGPVPDEPAIARTRERLKRAGLSPFPLPLGVDIDRWLHRAKTPWDAFPDAGHGKMDAESRGVEEALAHPNVELLTGARVERLLLEPDGRRIAGVEVVRNGERRAIAARLVVLAAGAVNSAALLLRSQANGVANRSGAVGRHFMNHNASAVVAIDPRVVNDSVYQKTLGINDFYLDDGRGGPPLGNIQLLGRVTAPILKSSIRLVPEWALGPISRRSVDWYAMSEDLPNPESRVTVDGERIRLDWKRSNWATHETLVEVFKERLRSAGYPIVVSRPFDRRTPSHQCGTVRMGPDPATSPLDPFCRAWDHSNLFVVDASFLPTSAAVNPSLTIAAQALRVADHIAKNDLRSI